MAAQPSKLGLDDGEDLFDFDELTRDVRPDLAEVNAALDAVIETVGLAPIPDDVGVDLSLADAGLFSDVPLPALPVVTHRAHRKPPPLAVPVRAAVRQDPAGSAQQHSFAPQDPASDLSFDSPEESTLIGTVRRRLTLTRSVVAFLLLLSVFNVVLVTFVMRTLASVESKMIEVDNRVVATTPLVPEQVTAVSDPVDVLPAVPEVATPSEGIEALQLAQQSFDAGAFARGRQTLFALLATIDGVPADTRRDVEARARFLIADSWRLEADRLDALGAPLAAHRTAEAAR